MCGNEFDVCAVWNESQPAAAKEHRCEECSAAIPKGAKHTRIKSLFDGHWYDNRVCTPCRDAWTEHLKHMREVHRKHCLIMIGGLSECMGEHAEMECPPPAPVEHRGTRFDFQ